MAEKKFRVKVHKSHLGKVSRAKPVQAVSELIWNSLDSDATSVDVFIKEYELGIEGVIVKDNGLGIKYESCEDLFSTLGGSWKAQVSTTEKGRELHGQEGQGRFKSFSIGRVVEWKTAYRKEAKSVSYSLICRADDIGDIVVTEPVYGSFSTGTTVNISEINSLFQGVRSEELRESLTPIFALYLYKYPNVIIRVDGVKLCPEDLIESMKEYELDDICSGNDVFKYSLKIIQWKDLAEREMYFCNKAGFSLHKYEKQIRGVGDFGFSAYLKSDRISQLNNQGVLGLSDFNNDLSSAIELAKDKIKNHFLEVNLRKSESRVKRWKSDGIYPYSGNPKNLVDEAERKVFDILAVNIAEDLPSFDESDVKLKRFQLRLLRQIVEKSPDELQIIMSEVLSLSSDKKKELACLLKETSLSAIISASNLVSERLKFLRGLEEVVFSKDFKKYLKERSQLHRILAENTWVFGDEYTLTVDDESLKRVLEEHSKSIDMDVVINSPVNTFDGKRGIVDLMLTRGVPCNHSHQREHLVVELKAPKVKIGEPEISQIKKYAYSVADDPRFINLETRWEFVVISSELTKFAEIELSQANYSDGVIIKTDSASGFDITVRVKTWSQLIQECKHRLEFIQKQLNINVDASDGLGYLKDKYSKYTEGLFTESTYDEAI